jgi:hypothetical protein
MLPGKGGLNIAMLANILPRRPGSGGGKLSPDRCDDFSIHASIELTLDYRFGELKILLNQPKYA